MKRGKNQVLFKYLPGKPIDYSNAIALVKQWWGKEVNDINKGRIIKEIYNSLKGFGKKRGYPPVADQDSYELLSPMVIEADLFPLTFVCESCNQAFTFANTKQLAITLRNHKKSCGGNLVQMDLVYIHECGELWAPRIPSCKKCGFQNIHLNKNNSSSPQFWRWECGICHTEITNLNNRCPTCQEGSLVYPRPFRQTNVFTPHLLTLVNLPNFDEEKIYENDIFRKLVIAQYFNLFEKYSTTFEECLGSTSENERKLEAFVEDLKSKGMPEYSIQSVLESMNVVMPNKKAIRDKIIAKVNENLSPPQGDSSQVALKCYEFMKTLEGSQCLSIKQVIENAKQTNHPNLDRITKFPLSLKNAGISNAHVLNNLSILKLVYGFTRGPADNENRVLNRFPKDRSSSGSLKEKIPIYLNKYETEAILLEVDRVKILKWLKINGIINETPPLDDEVAVKAWFLNNIDPGLISPYSEIENTRESLITREVYKLLHTISHALIITGSSECGLDKNSLAELILPNIPAIIVYCSNFQESQIGGLFTLFENNIYPWFDKTFEKVKSCLYDPICMDGQSACHACMHLSEISCVHFNHDVGRDSLVGKKLESHPEKIGFWSKSIIEG